MMGKATSHLGDVTMKNKTRSNICAEVTDQSHAEALKMTDKFLAIYYSNSEIDSCAIFCN